MAPPSDEDDISDPGTPAAVESVPRTGISLPQAFRTDRDSFGILREYSQGCPSITPDDYHSLSKKSDSPYHAIDHTETTVCELEASTTHLGAILCRFESEVSSLQCLLHLWTSFRRNSPSSTQGCESCKHIIDWSCQCQWAWPCEIQSQKKTQTV